MRTFLDEGEPMARLLFQAKTNEKGGRFATELLAAMVQAAGNPLAPTHLLSEPLTTREMEVLKLIESGLSNAEIAAKLFISLPTVKRHISNIYFKLGSNNRTQAVSRGKELQLF